MEVTLEAVVETLEKFEKQVTDKEKLLLKIRLSLLV